VIQTSIDLLSGQSGWGNPIFSLEKLLDDTIETSASDDGSER